MNITHTLITYRTSLTIAAALLFSVLIGVDMASAQACVPACGQGFVCVNGQCEEAQAGGERTDFGVARIEGGDEPIQLGSRNFIDAVVGIINVALGLLGIVAVVIILAGGFKWMTAGGNDDKVAEARKLIVSGVIGLAIIFSAWALTKFVITQLARATQSGDFESFEDF